MFSNSFDHGIDSYEYQLRRYEPDIIHTQSQPQPQFQQQPRPLLMSQMQMQPQPQPQPQQMLFGGKEGFINTNYEDIRIYIIIFVVIYIMIVNNKLNNIISIIENNSINRQQNIR